jgi:hypothetical protein
MTTETETPARAEQPLAACVKEEIAAIGGIDTAIRAEEDSGYVALLRDAKSEKQAAVEQLSTLLRMREQVPPESAFLLERVKKAQALVEGVNRSLAFAVFRDAESRLIERYRELGDSETEDFAKKVLSKVLERAVKRWHILTAHLAILAGDAAMAKSLPRPLAQYFVSSRPRVCMRCLFDRPGERKALHRTAPRPETYVCAACHDEVVTAFPPDLRVSLDRHSAEARQARVIEKALGKPQRVIASRTVLSALSGLPVQTPPRSERAFVESTPPRLWAVDPKEAESVIPRQTESPTESAYREALFDPDAVSRSW